jgi:hypothetical protein
VANGKAKSAFERFDRHPQVFSYLILTVYFFINAAINASSVWMEHSRSSNNTLQLWEPIVWEYSSAVSTLLLCPLLFWWFSRHPLQLSGIRRQLLLHLTGSLVFSVCHVAIMVGLRELIYHWQGGNYNFGPLLREFFYEYRKDAWGYLFFLLSYQLAQFVYSRIKGEAHQLDNAEESIATQPVKAPEHFLVKKLDKEFLIRVEDIEWLEASGNYVNLHSKGRIYPLRATLSNTLVQLNSKGFSRIHRSLAVNHNAIDSISYDSSGDGDILLKSGQQLALSRRFKDAFRAALQPDAVN